MTLVARPLAPGPLRPALFLKGTNPKMSWFSSFSSDNSAPSGGVSPRQPPSPRTNANLGGDNGRFVTQLFGILTNPLRTETTPLSLNASALEYVAMFLDKSRGETLSPTLHRCVVALEKQLLQVRHLKVEPARSLRRVDLSPFATLQVLEISGVAVECLIGHTALRMQLKCLRFERSPLDSVAALLGPGFKSRRPPPPPSPQAAAAAAAAARHHSGGLENIVGRRRSFSGGGSGGNFDASGAGELVEDPEWLLARWQQLSTLALNECSLAETLEDDTLRLAWQARVVELRGNGLTKIDDVFASCEQLEHLDLGHNLLTALPPLHLSLGNLTTLLLAHNQLRSTCGLERLYSLTEVDLSSNAISDVMEVRRLATLPNLESLCLSANPLATAPSVTQKSYRRSVFGVFMEWGGDNRGGHVDFPLLDGARITARDIARLSEVLWVRARPLATSSQSLQISAKAERQLTTHQTGDNANGEEGEGALVDEKADGNLRAGGSGGGRQQLIGRERSGSNGSFDALSSSRKRQRRPRRVAEVADLNPLHFDSFEHGRYFDPDELKELYATGSVAAFADTAASKTTTVHSASSSTSFGTAALGMGFDMMAVGMGSSSADSKNTANADDEGDEAGGYADASHPSPSTMYYTTVYVPRHRHRHRPRVPSVTILEDEDGDDGDDGSGGGGSSEEDEVNETLAEVITKLRTAHDIVPPSDIALSSSLPPSVSLNKRRGLSTVNEACEESESDDGEDSAGENENENGKEGGTGDGEGLLFRRLEALAQQMRAQGNSEEDSGVVRDHKVGKRVLRASVMGSEAVEWLVGRRGVCRGDEEQAVVVGNALMEAGLLKALFHQDSFRCTPNLFYRFTWDHEALIKQAAAVVGGDSGGSDVAGGRQVVDGGVGVGAADFAQFDFNDLMDMVERLRLGVSVKTRTPYRSIASVSAAGVYRRCFKGSDAVEWMIRSAEAMNEEEALELGAALLSQNIIYHCTQVSKRCFEDSKSAYYRFAFALVRRRRKVNVNSRPKAVPSEEGQSSEFASRVPKFRLPAQKATRGRRAGSAEDEWGGRMSGESDDGRDSVAHGSDDENGDKDVSDIKGGVANGGEGDTKYDDEDDDDDDEEVEFEEALTPANVTALSLKMRAVPGLVSDRSSASASALAMSVRRGSGADSASALATATTVTAKSSGGRGGGEEITVSPSATAEKEQQGQAVTLLPLCAYPSTFFGSEAVCWMGTELGLASEEDAMVVGDLMLYQGLIREVQAIDLSASVAEHQSTNHSTDNSYLEQNHRGFQNKRVYYRFSEDFESVARRVAEHIRSTTATMPSPSKAAPPLASPPPVEATFEGATSDHESAGAAVAADTSEQTIIAPQSSTVDLADSKGDGVDGSSSSFSSAGGSLAAGATELSSADASLSDSSPDAPRYVGDPSIADFAVGDDFAMYLRVQVFAPKQATASPRLAFRYASSSPQSKASSSVSVGLLRAPVSKSPDEELVAAYRIPALPWKTGKPTGMGHLFKEVPRLNSEGEPTKRPSSSSSRRRSFDASDSEGDTLTGTDAAESLVWLVLTTRHVYFLEDPSTDPAASSASSNNSSGRRGSSQLFENRFGDAPRPIVLRRFPLHCLQLLKIGFMFQTILLGFSGAEEQTTGGDGVEHERSKGDSDTRVSIGLSGTGLRPVGMFGSNVRGEQSPSPSPQSLSLAQLEGEASAYLGTSGGFVFLTRDKPATHALLQQMRELAMGARLKLKPPVTEHVLTSNMDETVLESLNCHLTSSLHGAASAVALYQLLHQRWKSKPGVLAPRTLILSEDRVLLVTEDHGGLGRGAPRVTVVDSAPLCDIASVRPEESPEQVTLLIRRPLKKKRWRLQLGDRRSAEKVVGEIRRRIGAEERDVDIDEVSDFAADLSQLGNRFSLPRPSSLFSTSSSS